MAENKTIEQKNEDIKRAEKNRVPGLNGRKMHGLSKLGKEYEAYSIYWLKKDGAELGIKQVFLSDLELEMIGILEKQV